MPPLVIATTNSHKTIEITKLLSQLADKWKFEDLTNYPELPPVPETGTTFEQNAALKAVATSHKLKGTLILADDSGIEVDALDGRPGVHSARFSGLDANDQSNRTLLLDELNGTPSPRRTGRFCCVMVLAKDGEVITTVRGEIEGTITEEERGDGGFGYDPVFVPEGHEETFAELSPDVKNSVSHRARALSKIAYYLRAYQH